jgi:RNA polymerase sigma-70 factor, ECF subfamily
MSAGQAIASALPGSLAMTGRSAPTEGASTPDERRAARIERLVRDHHAFVWRSVRRLGVRDADVDDVVQEVFLTAARHLDEIQHDRERGYLFRTSVFVAAHARRKVQRRREVVDDERMVAEVDGRPSPEQSAALSQTRARLQSMLDQLPEDFRAVFVLFELEGMTMSEIAEALKVPPGTVASRLRRARELFMTLATSARREGDVPK